MEKRQIMWWVLVALHNAINGSLMRTAATQSTQSGANGWRYPLGALEDGTDNLASIRERNGSEERGQLSSDGIGGRFERLE